jgi:hypothetical protein
VRDARLHIACHDMYEQLPSPNERPLVVYFQVRLGRSQVCVRRTSAVEGSVRQLCSSVCTCSMFGVLRAPPQLYTTCKRSPKLA